MRQYSTDEEKYWSRPPEKPTCDLIINPSPASEKIIEIVCDLADKHRKQIASRNILTREFYRLKLEVYLKEGHKDYYNRLTRFDHKFSPPPMSKNPRERIESLYKAFETEYGRVIFNNIALTHYYLKHGVVASNVKTSEDDKIHYLKKFHEKNISRVQFNDKYGHYALNAFELSSKRFEEYSDEELSHIAILVYQFPERDKASLDEAINSANPDIPSILVSLRELGKYNSLFPLKWIRYELLGLQRAGKIEDIFNHTYAQVMEQMK